MARHDRHLSRQQPVRLGPEQMVSWCPPTVPLRTEWAETQSRCDRIHAVLLSAALQVAVPSPRQAEQLLKLVANGVVEFAGGGLEALAVGDPHLALAVANEPGLLEQPRRNGNAGRWTHNIIARKSCVIGNSSPPARSYHQQRAYRLFPCC
jgi:hypothetical protein